MTVLRGRLRRPPAVLWGMLLRSRLRVRLLEVRLGLWLRPWLLEVRLGLRLRVRLLEVRLGSWLRPWLREVRLGLRLRPRLLEARLRLRLRPRLLQARLRSRLGAGLFDAGLRLRLRPRLLDARRDFGALFPYGRSGDRRLRLPRVGLRHARRFAMLHRCGLSGCAARCRARLVHGHALLHHWRMRLCPRGGRSCARLGALSRSIADFRGLRHAVVRLCPLHGGGRLRCVSRLREPGLTRR